MVQCAKLMAPWKQHLLLIFVHCCIPKGLVQWLAQGPGSPLLNWCKDKWTAESQNGLDLHHRSLSPPARLSIFLIVHIFALTSASSSSSVFFFFQLTGKKHLKSIQILSRIVTLYKMNTFIKLALGQNVYDQPSGKPSLSWFPIFHNLSFHKLLVLAELEFLTNGNTRNVFFHIWLLLLHTVFEIDLCWISSFLDTTHCVNILWLIYPSVNRHVALDLFSVLATRVNAAVSDLMYPLVHKLSIVLSMHLGGWQGMYFSVYVLPKSSPKWLYWIILSVWVFQLPHIPANTCYFCFFFIPVCV